MFTDDSAVLILQVATNLKVVPGIEVGGTGGQIIGFLWGRGDREGGGRGTRAWEMQTQGKLEL